MIGEIVFIGNHAYVEVNNKGTLEQLPALSWYRQLHLWFICRAKRLSYAEIKEYCNKYGNNFRWFLR